MSNPEDRAFDVYLARGSNLSQRYRDEASDKPGAALDSLILTASRRAKVSMTEMAVAPWYKRWRVPLAFAAVLVLGVGVALRTVLQETKLDEPAPVAPAPMPKNTPAPVEPAEDKLLAPSEPAGAAMGDPLSTPEDAGAITNNELRREKSRDSEEIIVEQEADQELPAAPPTLPEDSARAETPLPEANGLRPPRAAAPRGEDTVESQAGSGSSGSVLGDTESGRPLEQNTQADKSAGAAEQSDAESVARSRDQAPPEATEEAPPGAPPLPAMPPAEADTPVTRSESVGDGPRLPEGHAPIVDGKTFRANSAEAKRQAAEQEKAEQRAVAAIAADDAPEAWLRRVAELRRLGRDEDAKAELEQFRKRYPDYPAPITPYPSPGGTGK